MKKLFKGILLFLVAVIVLFSTYAFATGRTYLFKAVYYNFAGIDDYKIFNNNIVGAGKAQLWPVAGSYNKISTPGELNQLLADLKTVALVVIKKRFIII